MLAMLALSYPPHYYMKQYYYYHLGKATGPHSLDELQQLHDTGVISADTRISYEGADAWVSYESLCGVRGAGTAVSQQSSPPDSPAASGTDRVTGAAAAAADCAPVFPASTGEIVENACPHCKGAFCIGDDHRLPLHCPSCKTELRAREDGMWSQFLFVFSRYASFRGRARRREFWSYTLIVLLLGFATSFVGMSNIFALAVMLPSYAVMARRLHDIELSGWWVLPIKLLPTLCIAGAVTLYVSLVHQAFGSIQAAKTLIWKYFELKDKLSELHGVSGFVVRQQMEKMEETIWHAFADPLVEHISIYVFLLVVVPVSCMILGLIVCCRDSQSGVNKYGISPKYPLGKM